MKCNKEAITRGILLGLMLIFELTLICAQDMNIKSNEINIDNELLLQADEGPNSLPVIQFVSGFIFREIGLLGGDLMGIDGDVVPYSAGSGFDLGNNVPGQNWDQVVCNQLIEIAAPFRSNTNKNQDKVSENLLERILDLTVRTNKSEGVQKVYFDSDVLLEVFPEVFVNEDVDIDGRESSKNENRVPAIRISAFAPILVKSIQDQQNIIQEQSEMISILIKEIALLKKEVTELQK